MADASSPFAAAGSDAGVTAWKVDSNEPHVVPIQSADDFGADQGLLVLSTSTQADSKTHELFAWRGKQFDQDRLSVAAQQLKDTLGEEVEVLYEVQHSESSRFLEVFPFLSHTSTQAMHATENGNGVEHRQAPPDPSDIAQFLLPVKASSPAEATTVPEGMSGGSPQGSPSFESAGPTQAVAVNAAAASQAPQEPVAVEPPEPAIAADPQPPVAEETTGTAPAVAAPQGQQAPAAEPKPAAVGDEPVVPNTPKTASKPSTVHAAAAEQSGASSQAPVALEAAATPSGDDYLRTPSHGKIRELTRMLSSKSSADAPAPSSAIKAASVSPVPKFSLSTAEKAPLPTAPPINTPAPRITIETVTHPIVGHDKQNTINASQLLKMQAFKLQPLVDFVPYDELLKLRLEDGIDPTRREDYLTAEDFTQQFGMDRDAYAKLPAWKKQALKKKLNLF